MFYSSILLQKKTLISEQKLWKEYLSTKKTNYSRSLMNALHRRVFRRTFQAFESVQLKLFETNIGQKKLKNDKLSSKLDVLLYSFSISYVFKYYARI